MDAISDTKKAAQGNAPSVWVTFTVLCLREVTKTRNPPGSLLVKTDAITAPIAT